MRRDVVHWKEETKMLLHDAYSTTSAAMAGSVFRFGRLLMSFT